MRFFKRESRLESLERQLHIIDGQIGKAKASLTARKGPGPIDNVLRNFLQERFAFDYDFEKQKLERIIRAKEAELAQLEKEKTALIPQLQEEVFNEKLKTMQISFSGKDVQTFKGSVVTVKCHSCGCIFDLDVRNRGSFANLLQAESENELKLLYNRKNNNVWPENCPNCGSPLDIWFWRGKI
jgi:succinate dehydrogenase flavin-adding protein (antitoxin of CptAB toxin-antitoxin module)